MLPRQKRKGKNSSYLQNPFHHHLAQIWALLFREGRCLAACCVKTEKTKVPFSLPCHEAAMATGGPVKQLCKEVTCSICLDYFKDPVTIAECGHSFCQGCLAQGWGWSEASCPLCKRTVQTRNLQPSQQLANVVEIAKELEKQVEGEGRRCEKHQEPLKLFCQQDQILICLVCDRSKEHRSHEVVPLEEASQEYRVKFHASLKIVREERAKILAHKANLMEESQALLEQTKSQSQKTVAEFRKLHQFLEEQEKLLLGKMAFLEKEIARERDELLARLSSELSCLESLIRDMEEKQQQPDIELLQDVRSTLKRYEEKQKFGDLVAFAPELKQKICNVHGINDFLEDHMKQFKDSLASGPPVQKAVKVTLDPDTAHPQLVLSEDWKSVKWQKEYQELPNKPERFDFSPCVMGCEEFTAGQHFWEVMVGNKDGWTVGVARKSVRRKGKIPWDPEEGIWALSRWVCGLFAHYHPDSHILPLSGGLKRIRVSLDYEGGRVTFLDADRATVLYEFLGASFRGETLQPFFYVIYKGHFRLTP